MKVASLYIHPIKGCRASSVDVVDVNQEGLVGDRAYMVINQEGAHLSQKHCPRLATLVATLTGDGLKIEAADGDAFEHSMRMGIAVSARIHSTDLTARDQGEEIADWLSQKLNIVCRLVAAPEGYQRNVPFPSLGDIDGQRVTLFNDLAPVLLTAQASLDDLNHRLDSPVPMARFRPNVVLENTAAWEEDSFDVISNGLLALERRAPLLVDDHTRIRRSIVQL